MKQHISPEDIKTLTPEQQEKLRSFWKPQEGDWYIDRDINECIVNNEEMTSWTTPDKYSLPLLSIGQLLQLLELKIGMIETCFGQQKRWYVEMLNGECLEDKELVDCLFRAVKEIL